MRLLSLAALAAALLAPAYSQVRGGARPSSAPVRRQAAPTPARPANGVRPVSPAARPGGGLGVGTVASPIGGPVVFFGYYPNPLYYGSGDSFAAPADAAPAPAYYGADPGAQGYPSVLVNPYYTPDTSHPVMHDYSYLPPGAPAAPDGGEAALTPPASTPSVVFLIAMKDHTIYPAIAYWVEDDTLHYITQQGVQNRVSLGLVDRDFSAQLNKERGIDFSLPQGRTN